jgi:hypothetical protein
MNFDEILETKVDAIERPPLLPLGFYVFAVTKVEFDREKPDFDIVNMQCKVIRPEAVDEDDLAKFGTVAGQPQRLSFMFDKNDETRAKQTLFRLRTFLESHVGCAEADMPLKAALAAATNRQFIGQISWRADKNNAEIQYAEIKKTAPLE